VTADNTGNLLAVGGCTAGALSSAPLAACMLAFLGVHSCVLAGFLLASTAAIPFLGLVWDPAPPLAGLLALCFVVFAAEPRPAMFFAEASAVSKLPCVKSSTVQTEGHHTSGGDSDVVNINGQPLDMSGLPRGLINAMRAVERARESANAVQDISVSGPNTKKHHKYSTSGSAHEVRDCIEEDEEIVFWESEDSMVNVTNASSLPLSEKSKRNSTNSSHSRAFPSACSSSLRYSHSESGYTGITGFSGEVGSDRAEDWRAQRQAKMQTVLTYSRSSLIEKADAMVQTDLVPMWRGQSQPRGVNRGTETSIVWARDGFQCRQCMRPPTLPTSMLAGSLDSLSSAGKSAKHSGREVLRSAQSQIRGMKRRAGSAAGGSAAMWSEVTAAMSSQHNWQQADPIATCFRLTSPLSISLSLQWAMKHWNLPRIGGSCCPWHTALLMAKRALDLERGSCCDPLWSGLLGWQCPECSSMNHEEVLRCDMCFEGKPSTCGSDSENPTASQTLSHVPTDGSAPLWSHAPV